MLCIIIIFIFHTVYSMSLIGRRVNNSHHLPNALQPQAAKLILCPLNHLVRQPDRASVEPSPLTPPRTPDHDTLSPMSTVHSQCKGTWTWWSRRKKNLLGSPMKQTQPAYAFPDPTSFGPDPFQIHTFAPMSACQKAKPAKLERPLISRPCLSPGLPEIAPSPCSAR